MRGGLSGRSGPCGCRHIRSARRIRLPRCGTNGWLGPWRAVECRKPGRRHRGNLFALSQMSGCACGSGSLPTPMNRRGLEILQMTRCGCRSCSKKSSRLRRSESSLKTFAIVVCQFPEAKAFNRKGREGFAKVAKKRKIRTLLSRTRSGRSRHRRRSNCSAGSCRYQPRAGWACPTRSREPGREC
jgi:hypothetical protein